MKKLKVLVMVIVLAFSASSFGTTFACDECTDIENSINLLLHVRCNPGVLYSEKEFLKLKEKVIAFFSANNGRARTQKISMDDFIRTFNIPFGGDACMSLDYINNKLIHYLISEGLYLSSQEARVFVSWAVYNAYN